MILRYLRITYLPSCSKYSAGPELLLCFEGMQNFVSSPSDRCLIIGALEISFITNSWPLLVLGDTSDEDLDTRLLDRDVSRRGVPASMAEDRLRLISRLSMTSICSLMPLFISACSRRRWSRSSERVFWVGDSLRRPEFSIKHHLCF